MSWENLTHANRNPLQQRCKTKCARDIWVRKTRFVTKEIHYNGDIGENMLEACKPRKLWLIPEEIHYGGDTWQNVLDAYVRKTQPMPAKIYYDGGIRRNVLDVCKSSKLISCKKKSTMMDAQDKMCPRHVSWKNIICVRRNLLWWRHRTKYTSM